MRLMLREATLADLDFLVQVDITDEGCTSTYMESWGLDELTKHRDKIAAFITENGKAAWVYEDTESSRLVGMILWLYRNRLLDTFEAWSIFPQFDESLFPPNGAFCDIYQLWIAPEYRRRGLASNLKQQAEIEALRRGVKMLYTTTEASNTHVIEMNLKLGYREIRRGPIWDEVIRVILIKTLGE